MCSNANYSAGKNNLLKRSLGVISLDDRQHPPAALQCLRTNLYTDGLLYIDYLESLQFTDLCLQ